MPKSKHAPALFELLGDRGEKKGTDKLAVPKWLKTTPSAAPSRPEPPAAAVPPPEPAPQPAPATAVAPRPTAPAASRTVEDGEPVARVHSGRIELSLNPTNIAIAGGVLVLVLLGVYLAGQGLAARGKGSAIAGGGPTRVDDVRLAMNQPANADATRNQRNSTTLMAPRLTAKNEADPTSEKPTAEKSATPSPASAAPRTATAAPTGGPNRIVVERFKPADRKSAEHVQKWLAESYSCKTELMTINDSIWLVTAEGLDLSQPGQKEYRDALIKDLKSLGKECAKELASHNLPRYTLSGPEVHRFDK